MNNAEQADTPTEVEHPRPGDTGYSTFLSALPHLLRTQMDSWSCTEIDRLVSVLGWPAQQTNPRENVRIGIEADGIEVVLRADTTYFDMDPDRWGFGEFGRISLSQSLNGDVGAVAYRAALQTCVEELGPPSLVGGPGALAIWRGPQTTLTLSSTSWLSLDIEPTEPTESYRYWEWKWGDDWSADDAWMVVPNMRDTRFGLPQWWHPEPAASTWADFEDHLDTLTHSLLTDLPLLHPYATEITWSLSAPTSRSVQCWFSPDGVRVGTWRTGESDWTTTIFSTGLESADAASDAIKTAVRGLDVASPTDLRLDASCRTGRQRLATIRLGVREHRPTTVLSPAADPLSDLSAQPAVPPVDWAAFTPRLALVLQAMPDYGVLIIEAPGNRYAQFARTGNELEAEIVGQHYLADTTQLTAADVTAMTESGWDLPDGDAENWHREIHVATDTDRYLELAGFVTDALSRILRVELPTDLEVSAFSNGHDCFDPETAALGIRSRAE
ncbi:TY-Chap domain-containing protein [Nocardia sp.]|uniref:TY-Chap domain-containing protein n=1 Tax=Nocardia sp. TaxID=1821 RepID=UPI0026280715|nr:hypothetical protein [Nocardia sp.]